MDDHEHVLICPDCDKTPTELGYVLTSNTPDSLRDKIERLLGTAILKNDKNYTTDLMQLIEQDKAAAVTAAREDQIMEDELSLEFLTDDIGRDIFPDENLLIDWRLSQLAKLKTQQGDTE